MSCKYIFFFIIQHFVETTYSNIKHSNCYLLQQILIWFDSRSRAKNQKWKCRKSESCSSALTCWMVFQTLVSSVAIAASSCCCWYYRVAMSGNQVGHRDRVGYCRQLWTVSCVTGQLRLWESTSRCPQMRWASSEQSWHRGFGVDVHHHHHHYGTTDHCETTDRHRCFSVAASGHVSVAPPALPPCESGRSSLAYCLPAEAPNRTITNDTRFQINSTIIIGI